MLEFNQSDTTVEFILTLTENVTVLDPVYDFSFVHVLTKTVVAFTKTTSDDESDFPGRYNAFTINTNLFTQPGEWHYTVTEQQTGIELEKGKLLIDRDFNITMYDSATTYKTYNG
jgi:VCBS repeat-containing protein